MNVKMVFNMEAPDIMFRGLNERVPAITSCLVNYAEKYQLHQRSAQLKHIIIDLTEKAHDIANNHAPHLSQVSILFRKTVVQYQRTVQVILDGVVKVLRETYVTLPGSEETIPLIEVINKMTTSIVSMVEQAIDQMVINAEYAYRAVVNMVSKIQVTMPIGDVMAGAKIIDKIKETVRNMPNPVVDGLKHLESVDIALEKVGDTLKNIVERTQDFVDNSLRSDILDAIAVYINALYDTYATCMKTVISYLSRAVDTETMNDSFYYILESFRAVVNAFYHNVTEYLQQAPNHYRDYIKVKGRKLEINI